MNTLNMVGLSQRRAPIALLERVGVRRGEQGSFLAALRASTFAGVICPTSAAQHVVTLAQVREAMSTRSARPLTVADLSVPRNVDAGIAALADVRLIDLELTMTPSGRAPAEQDLARAAHTIAGKVLHGPRIAVRTAAATGDTGLLERLREIFGVRTSDLDLAAVHRGSVPQRRIDRESAHTDTAHTRPNRRQIPNEINNRVGQRIQAGGG